VGDLTIIDHGEVYPIEVKLATKRKRFDRRTIRQKRKMKTLKEWYHDGKSDKILSGYTAIRQTISKRDEHNWKEITNVLNKAEKNGYFVQPVENCLIYAAFTTEDYEEKIINSLADNWTKPIVVLGSLDRHLDGLPEILPFPVFDIPIEFKLKLLLGRINFCTFLDINSLCNVLNEHGFEAIVDTQGEFGPIKVTTVSGNRYTLGYGTIQRLLYGGLSIQTVINYSEMADDIKLI